MNGCRYCNQAVPESDSARTLAYWNQTPDVCHAACKAEGERLEALECQTIDADCNDCRHYKRGKLADKMREWTKTTDGRMVEIVFQPNIFIGGHCLKFDQPTVAQPKKWAGWECFEHRRAV